jgi:hypothetical protein
MNPTHRRSLPPGDGDYSLFWLGARAYGRLALSYQLPKLNPYPHRRYTPMSRLDMGSSRREGKAMCNMDVMEAPHSVELAALVRRYQALVDETLAVAASGFNPAQIAGAREAAAEALRMIRTFAVTHAGAQAQAAASALAAGEANLI